MKRTLRLIVLLLALCVSVSLLSSCWAFLLLPNSDETRKTETSATVAVTEADPLPEDPARPDLSYTLTDRDFEILKDALDRMETLILERRIDDEEEILQSIEAVETQYYHIATQSELAYIYYCMNVASEERSEAYLTSSAMLSDAYELYLSVCRRIDQSDAPYREAFFADWSAADLDEMRRFSPEQTALSQANDELLVRFRALSEENFSGGAASLYYEMMCNNNQIAMLNGCHNYPEYAYEKVYHRDYSYGSSKQLHNYVKTYLIPVCTDVYNHFQTSYRSLNNQEQKKLLALINGEYSEVKNEIKGYLATYPPEVAADMWSMFESGNLFYTNAENANAGAFTAYLYEYERPVCYFGPDYHSGYTVVHEMGHYYAALLSNGEDVQMDIAETQSQANEWLFTEYLVRTKSKNFADAVFYYQLYSSLASIVLSSIVDEFEQNVYFYNPPKTADDFDSLMNGICDTYGGREWLMTLFADPLTYWRRVALENPCYYVSYAYSMLVSIDFYCLARKAPSRAQEIYLELAAGDMGGLTYPEWLRSVGLATPFDKTLYESIAALCD